MHSFQSIRDRLGVTRNPDALRSAAFKVISRTQEEPDTQIAATATALVAMCEACGVNMRHLIETTERSMAEVDSPFSGTIRAIREYARNEITRRT